MRLTDRELATVLAALRFWQGEWAPTAAAPEMPDTGEFSGYFAEVEPLTEDEIDELCERLNTRPAAAAPAQDEHPNTDEHRAACVQCMTEHDAAQPDGHAEPAQ